MKNVSTTIGLNFSSVVWPIFIDNFLRMLVLAVSYGVVSRISDAMAAVVGITNLYLLMGFSFVECLAQGGSIIFAQYLGAKKDIEVGQAYTITIWINACIGLLLTILCSQFSDGLLSTFGFSDHLLSQGSYYLSLVGSGFWIYSINYVFLYILNANGLTKYSMSYSLIVNGISIGFYYLIAVLPPSFSVNRLTLIGLTNIFVRCIGMLFLFIVIRKNVPNFYLYSNIPWEIIKSYIRKFLKVSIPNALEPLSYQLFQFTILKIISSISFESMSVRSYIISLAALFETGAFSISRGNQVFLGYLIGAKQSTELVNTQLRKGVTASVVVSLVILCFGMIYRHKLMYFFSRNTSIIDTGAELLILVALLTILRSLTFNLYAGLKAAGDIKFGVMLTMIGMWGIIIPGSYALTCIFNSGLTGIWIMFIINEFLLSFFLSWRWRSEKWRNFSLIE